MNQYLSAYPEYKPAGLPWLVEVPAHWKVTKVKHLFRERSEKGYPDEPLLAATQKQGVVLKTMVGSRTVEASKDFHLLKLVRVGDFVISLRSFEGGIEYAHYQGIISPAYNVLTPNEADDALYLAYLLKSKPFVESLTLFVTGIREGQNIDNAKFSISSMPIPPLPEQQRIVAFLDGKTRQIARLLRNKRQLIKLLTEQKQALIHHAVTQGLDPDAPRKESGLAWLGEVPAHWDVVKLSRVVNLLTGYPFASSDFSKSPDAIRLLRGINVTPIGIRWESVVKWERRPNDKLDAFLLKAGDIVLGMDRPIISTGVRVTIVQPTDLPSLLLQRVACLRPVGGISNEFLVLLLKGKMFAQYMEPIFTGISVPHLSPEQIKAFRVALPPIKEQQTIVAYIKSETRLLDETIARAQREIELIQEYRTRLIADVVTGRVDVQQLADTASGVELPTEDELDLEDEESEEELLIETEDGRE